MNSCDFPAEVRRGSRKSDKRAQPMSCDVQSNAVFATVIVNLIGGSGSTELTCDVCRRAWMAIVCLHSGETGGMEAARPVALGDVARPANLSSRHDLAIW